MTALMNAKALSRRARKQPPTVDVSAATDDLSVLVDAATSLLELSPPVPATCCLPPYDLHRSGTPDRSVASGSSAYSESNSGRLSPTTTIISVSSIIVDKKQSFAESLMDMLLDEQYSGIVTFLPDGKQFGIIHAKNFCEQVMPTVFGIRTFSSFVRKLSRWGFERVMEKKTHDVDVFRHDFFTKGNWSACAKIKCVGRLTKPIQVERPKEADPTCEPTAQQQQPVPDMRGLMQAQLARRVSLQKPLQVNYGQASSLHSMTSHIVGAALDTLRRDTLTSMPGSVSNLQALLAQQRQHETMQARKSLELASMYGVSPRSSMCLSFGQYML
jgi:hypothetical protein